MDISFDVFLEGILGAAELVSDKVTLKAVWLGGDRKKTSMVNFDEMYEQLFGDLYLDDYLEDITSPSYMTLGQSQAVRAFIEQIHVINDRYFKLPNPQNLNEIIETTEWEAFSVTASRVLLEFREYA